MPGGPALLNHLRWRKGLRLSCLLNVYVCVDDSVMSDGLYKLWTDHLCQTDVSRGYVSQHDVDFVGWNASYGFKSQSVSQRVHNSVNDN